MAACSHHPKQGRGGAGWRRGRGPGAGGRRARGGPAVPGAHGPPGPFGRPLFLGRGGWPRGAITSKQGRVAPWGGGQASEGGPGRPRGPRAPRALRPPIVPRPRWVAAGSHHLKTGAGGRRVASGFVSRCQVRNQSPAGCPCKTGHGQGKTLQRPWSEWAAWLDGKSCAAAPGTRTEKKNPVGSVRPSEGTASRKIKILHQPAPCVRV